MHGLGSLGIGMAALALLVSTPAHAEITDQSDDGFITRHELVVAASPKETWLALISPTRWWSSEHTWSADAANLKLTPQAGGCFCETIPEVNEPDRFTLEGSVEHMRVIQAYPERALRMVGALGPLQSEPVTGVLTIALSEAEGGTKVVWEYNVGGPMRYEVPVISKAVDGVMQLQLNGLGDLLGVVEAIEAPAEPEPDAQDEPEAPTGAATIIDPDDLGDINLRDDGVTGGEAGGAASAPGPSVDEAFSDLSREDNDPEN